MKHSSHKTHTHHQSCSDTVLMGSNQMPIRLAAGESWTSTAVALALLITSDSYRHKMPGHIQQCHGESAHTSSSHMLIRRNSFQPEFEPSRHEMRIFDDLDGIVMEM